MKQRVPPSVRTIQLNILWLLGLAAAVAARLVHFRAVGSSNDEGAYLMWARLVAEGYPLYRETVSVSAPLFIEMLAGVFRLFGFGIVAGRMTILFTFVGTALVMGWLARKIAGWTGAFFALGILAFAPQFFRLSREVMGEMPATLFAVLAVALAFGYFQNGEKWLLAAAGAAFTISFLMKGLYPAAAVPVGWFILVRGKKNWRQIFADGLLFGAVALGVMALVVSRYPWDAFFSQAVAFRDDLRAVFPLDVVGNLGFIWQEMRPIWSVWLLGLTGIVVGRNSARAWAWTLWLAAALALVVWHTPLFGQHLISLLPPLILLCAEAVATLKNYLSAEASSAKKYFAMTFILLPILNIPATINYAWQKVNLLGGGGREIDAVHLLQTVTRPTDFVVADSQMLALEADRLTPPPMGDIAFVAIFSGHQTSARLIALSEQYDVQAVAAWVGRTVWLPEYLDWAAKNFYGYREYDLSHRIYFARRPAPGAPIPHETQICLGDAINFRGYRLDGVAVAGRVLPVTLFWEAEQSSDRNYTVFAQLLDASGRLVAQHDGQPVYGVYPTSRWQPGELIADRVDIPLPDNLPAGKYRLIAGLYDLETMKRLPVQGGGDFVDVTPVTVK